MEDRVVGSADSDARSAYSPPRLTRWGSVADLTLVGQTNPGSDTLIGRAQGRDGGSVIPPGLG